MGMLIFSQIALNCQDAAVTETYYAKYFGFRRARVAKLPDGGQIVFLKMLDSSIYLELFQATESSPLPPPEKDGYVFPATVRQLGFKVDSVDAKLAEIEAGGDLKVSLGPFNFDDYIPGWRTVWIADPDGTIIELSQGFVDEESPEPLA